MPQLPPGAPRLLVAFADRNIRALELLPAVLREYATALLLNTSFIQLLDFVDEDVLQEALGYLRDEPCGLRSVGAVATEKQHGRHRRAMRVQVRCMHGKLGD
eukprot:352984-Chlamydomonas_euryale.AAC.4